MIVDELVTLLGLRQDPRAVGEAREFKGLLDGILKGAALLGTALAGAAKALQIYAARQAQAIDTGAEFAEMLGISYQRLQELEYAITLSGGSADVLRADLERLQEMMRNPATGDLNKGLVALGINVRDATGEFRAADDVLLDIAKRFETLSKPQQAQFARSLRLSPATVRLLQNGRKGLADLAKEARELGLVMDDTAAQKAARFGDSFDRVRAIVDAVGKSISVSLLPGLTDTADAFAEWVKRNREFIQSGVRQVVEGVGRGFEMIGDAVGTAWRWLQRFLPAGEQLNKTLDATQAIAIAVALAMASVAVAVLAATWPTLAVTAAIAALVLVVEDLYAWLNDGESIIGGWVQSFKDAYPELAEALTGLYNLLDSIGALVRGALVEAFKFLGDIAMTVLGTWVKALNVVLKTVNAIIGAVKSPDLGQFGTTFGGAVPEGRPSIYASPEEWAAWRTRSAVPAGVAAGAARGGAGGDRNTTINVNGAGNPMAVADEVVRRGGLGETVQTNSPGMFGPMVY